MRLKEALANEAVAGAATDLAPESDQLQQQPQEEAPKEEDQNAEEVVSKPDQQEADVLMHGDEQQQAHAAAHAADGTAEGDAAENQTEDTQGGLHDESGVDHEHHTSDQLEEQQQQQQQQLQLQQPQEADYGPEEWETVAIPEEWLPCPLVRVSALIIPMA